LLQSFISCCIVNSVVRLIEQYLKENNLMKTLIMLQVNDLFGLVAVLFQFFCYWNRLNFMSQLSIPL